MPYKIQRRAGEYIVISESSRRILGHHKTRADALKQQRFLYKEGVKEGISVFKDVSGRLRWISVSSTSYMDRDGEIVSLRALKNDVEYSDGTGYYGPLRWWHVPGIDIGYCDFRIVVGKALVESGLFATEAIGQKMKELSHLLGMSIGFIHPINEPVKRVYNCIITQERSVLPKYAASNLFTRVGIVDTG